MPRKRLVCPACQHNKILSGPGGLVEMGCYNDHGGYDAEQDGQYYECAKCGYAWVEIDKTNCRCPECDSLSLDMDDGCRPRYKCNECEHEFEELE